MACFRYKDQSYTIAVCFENHMKNKKFIKQNTQFFYMLKQVVHIVASVPQGVQGMESLVNRNTCHYGVAYVRLSSAGDPPSEHLSLGAILQHLPDPCAISLPATHVNLHTNYVNISRRPGIEFQRFQIVPFMYWINTFKYTTTLPSPPITPCFYHARPDHIMHTHTCLNKQRLGSLVLVAAFLT